MCERFKMRNNNHKITAPAVDGPGSADAIADAKHKM